MLFKLSNLNSNLTLTLGYLNPALNNSALGEERHCEAKSFVHGSNVMATLGHGPADLKFEVITVQPANLTSIQWAPILVPAFLQSFSVFFLQKVLVDRANKLSSMPQPRQRPSKRQLTPHTKSSFVHQKESRKVSKLILAFTIWMIPPCSLFCCYNFSFIP